MTYVNVYNKMYNFKTVLFFKYSKIKFKFRKTWCLASLKYTHQDPKDSFISFRPKKVLLKIANIFCTS